MWVPAQTGRVISVITSNKTPVSLAIVLLTQAVAWGVSNRVSIPFPFADTFLSTSAVNTATTAGAGANASARLGGSRATAFAFAPTDYAMDLSRLPRISDLAREHRTTIAAVRKHPVLKGELRREHDDLFVLRYVLTYDGDVDAIAKAIKRALDWRRDHADLLARAEALQPSIRAVSPIGMLPWRTGEGQPVQLAMPCAGDTSTLARKSDEWHMEAGISNRAVAFAACDKLSRETGRLVRLVLLQDLTGLSVGMAMRHRRIAQVQGKLSELQDVLYPQLLDKVILTHPPPYISALFQIARPLLSKQILERTRVAPKVQTIVSEAPLPEEYVPVWLGGQNDWTPDWVPDTLLPSAKRGRRRWWGGGGGGGSD